MRWNIFKYISLFLMILGVCCLIKAGNDRYGGDQRSLETGNKVELIQSDTSDVACPTGIPVFSKTDSVKNGKNGLQITVQAWSQYNTPYTYQEEFRLSKLDGDTFIALDLKDGVIWPEKEYTLKRNKKTEIVFDVGKYYGELQPGLYSVHRALNYTYPKSGQENSISVSASFVVKE